MCLIECYVASGQERWLTLVIDTVNSPIDSFAIRVNRPEMTWEDLQAEETVVTVDKRSSPNVTIRVGPIRTNTVIELPLDDNQGYVALKNTFSISCDTIHLNRLPIYHNCFSDSVHLFKTWYRRYPDTSYRSVILYSEEIRAVRGRTKCHPKYPSREHFTINDKAYDVELSVGTKYGGTLIAGHGYRYKYKRVLRREQKGKSNLYFHFEGNVHHYSLLAEVTIDK